jgi:molybdopterin synthase catalytic subunit
LNKANEQLEAALQEKTLDFEEMKRRLVKAVRYGCILSFLGPLKSASDLVKKLNYSILFIPMK